jgi:hypothetical protein
MADDAVAVKLESGGDANANANGNATSEAVVVKAEKVEPSAAAASASGPRLDGALFFRRLQKLYASWKQRKAEAAWGDVSAFCVPAGRAQQDESGYRKSAVLQIYLLGYVEFPETIMVFTPETLFVLTSGKKCECGIVGYCEGRGWVDLLTGFDCAQTPCSRRSRTATPTLPSSWNC